MPVLSALSPLSILQKLKFSWASWGATLAFSLYLTHKQIIHLCHIVAVNLGQDKNSFVVFIFTTTVCIVASLILYYLIERPFLTLKDRILEQKKCLPDSHDIEK